MRTLGLMALILSAAGPVLGEEAVPKPNRRLFVVGYDLGGNAQAVQTLNAMKESARAAGAQSEVMLAGQDEKELSAALSQAFTPAPPPPKAPELRIQSLSLGIPCKAVVRCANFKAAGAAAWIGVYKQNAPHEEYVAYTFVNNLTDDTYDVQLKEEGAYEFRLFPGKEYAPIAATPPFRVVRPGASAGR